MLGRTSSGRIVLVRMRGIRAGCLVSKASFFEPMFSFVSFYLSCSKSAVEVRIASAYLIKDLVMFEVVLGEGAIGLLLKEVENGYERPNEGNF